MPAPTVRDPEFSDRYLHFKHDDHALQWFYNTWEDLKEAGTASKVNGDCTAAPLQIPPATQKPPETGQWCGQEDRCSICRSFIHTAKTDPTGKAPEAGLRILLTHQALWQGPHPLLTVQKFFDWCAGDTTFSTQRNELAYLGYVFLTPEYLAHGANKDKYWLTRTTVRLEDHTRSSYRYVVLFTPSREIVEQILGEWGITFSHWATPPARTTNGRSSRASSPSSLWPPTIRPSFPSSGRRSSTS